MSTRTAPDRAKNNRFRAVDPASPTYLWFRTGSPHRPRTQPEAVHAAMPPSVEKLTPGCWLYARRGLELLVPRALLRCVETNELKSKAFIGSLRDTPFPNVPSRNSASRTQIKWGQYFFWI